MGHFTLLTFLILFSFLAFGQREDIQQNPVGPFTDGGIKAAEDTLTPTQFITPGCSTLSAYRISSGYLCGTNGMHDKEKAERFRNAPVNIKVNSVIALLVS